MFYTILFFLAFYSFGKSMKQFVKENVVIRDGKYAEVPRRAYISLGLTAIFHIMVLALCLLPSMLLC